MQSRQREACTCMCRDQIFEGTSLCWGVVVKTKRQRRTWDSWSLRKWELCRGCFPWHPCRLHLRWQQLSPDGVLRYIPCGKARGLCATGGPAASSSVATKAAGCSAVQVRPSFPCSCELARPEASRATSSSSWRLPDSRVQSQNWQSWTTLSGRWDVVHMV